mmetsp:Transcript_150357/g.287957  ORF Transcript_150357/g.287957 Transcript_150357/m.287957 type:complete len:231 (+) Transcript_150357:3014-3706(+)
MWKRRQALSASSKATPAPPTSCSSAGTKMRLECTQSTFCRTSLFEVLPGPNPEGHLPVASATSATSVTSAISVTSVTSVTSATIVIIATLVIVVTLSMTLHQDVVLSVDHLVLLTTTAAVRTRSALLRAQPLSPITPRRVTKRDQAHLHIPVGAVTARDVDNGPLRMAVANPMRRLCLTGLDPRGCNGMRKSPCSAKCEVSEGVDSLDLAAFGGDDWYFSISHVGRFLGS